MSHEFHKYPDREMLAMDLANQLAGDLRAALQHDERVLLAVPGGTSPGHVFDNLCGVELDWSRVDVMLTDERWVPEDHERSNTRLLRERLLVDKAAAAGYIPLYTDADEPDDALHVASGDNQTGLGPARPVPLDPEPAIGIDHDFDDGGVVQRTGDF